MTNGPLFMAQECMVFSHEKRRNVEINKPLFQTLTFALYKKYPRRVGSDCLSHTIPTLISSCCARLLGQHSNERFFT